MKLFLGQWHVTYATVKHLKYTNLYTYFLTRNFPFFVFSSFIDMQSQYMSV